MPAVDDPKSTCEQYELDSVGYKKVAMKLGRRCVVGSAWGVNGGLGMDMTKIGCVQVWNVSC